MIATLSFCIYESVARGESVEVMIGGACFFFGIFVTILFNEWNWIIAWVKSIKKMSLRAQAMVLVVALFIFLGVIINPIYGHKVETLLVMYIVFGSLFYFPAMDFWHNSYKKVEIRV
ncbi:MAG: hypothetical protein PHY72_00735 [Candidatus Pacebacteria bacterium]|nr:hypothetical protein [Candidatus Paceibacterota bacterium]